MIASSSVDASVPSSTTEENSPTDLLQQSIGPACHELRSPLAVVYGFAKMLENNEAVTDAERRYVSAIVEGAQRLDHLLDDLAHLGRIASGRLQPSTERISVAKVADDVSSRTQNHARLSIGGGNEACVNADPKWLADVFNAVIDSCCFDSNVDVAISWSAEDEVRVRFAVVGDTPLPDTDPEKARLCLAVARMRLTAMGGHLDSDGSAIVVSMPRA